MITAAFAAAVAGSAAACGALPTSPAQQAMRSCMVAMSRAHCECAKNIFSESDFDVYARFVEVGASETDPETRRYRQQAVVMETMQGSNIAGGISFGQGANLVERQCRE